MHLPISQDAGGEFSENVCTFAPVHEESEEDEEVYMLDIA